MGKLAAALIISISFATTAAAQPLVGDALAESRANYSLRDGLPSLDYRCGEECFVLRLVCSGSGHVDVTLVLGRRDLIAWLEATDDFAPPTADIIADGAVLPLVFSSFGIIEMTGDWFATLTWPIASSPSPIALFGNADESVLLRSPGFDLAFPHTPEDRTNRAAFVEACLAM